MEKFPNRLERFPQSNICGCRGLFLGFSNMLDPFWGDILKPKGQGADPILSLGQPKGRLCLPKWARNAPGSGSLLLLVWGRHEGTQVYHKQGGSRIVPCAVGEFSEAVGVTRSLSLWCSSLSTAAWPQRSARLLRTHPPCKSQSAVRFCGK